MTRSTFLVTALLALAACNDRTDRNESPPAPAPSKAGLQPRARTVIEFLEEPAALEEAWARCRNDPGGIGQTPDCANAGHAKERLMMLGRERAIESLRR
jgi:hypothetical protein